MRRTVSVGRQSPAARPRPGIIALADKPAAAESTARREIPWLTYRSLFLFMACKRRKACPDGQADGLAQALVEAQQLEQRRQVAEFLPGRRRGAADEIEDLAVLQPVVGEALHLALLVEVDRDHPLIDHLLVHESDRTLGTLRDVIEHLAVERGDRRRGPHNDQHLVLARPDRNLLKRAGREDVSLLKLLAGASTERCAQECDGRRRSEGARQGHA